MSAREAKSKGEGTSSSWTGMSSPSSPRRERRKGNPWLVASVALVSTTAGTWAKRRPFKVLAMFDRRSPERGRTRAHFGPGDLVLRAIDDAREVAPKIVGPPGHQFHCFGRRPCLGVGAQASTAVSSR